MKLALPLLVVLGVVFFVFRSGPVGQEERRSAELKEAVDSPEQSAARNYLKSPIDRTKAVVEQVKRHRAGSGL